MSDPQKYTIGWICAITTEFVAARAFLDEEHDTNELVVATNDCNSYALGMISRHNVVIAVMPDGEYGTTTAATVARSMMHSFPNVRIGLMVGIGGGAPSSRRDIRLGDVVVNRTAGGLGGVLQYDYGATMQAQGFRNMSFLNQSPEVLRTSVAALRATHEMKGHKLEKSVDEALGNIKKRSKYKRPFPESDRLYMKDVLHHAEKSGGKSRTYGDNNSPGCDVTCGTDASLLIQRPDRDDEDDDPAIHYGLIASGNSLVRDANMRDRLASEEDVLCFEMEAAGLMNHFPCLVIRGICDYCDSHKNKEWQGFAAMMAAAYAKDLLKQIPRNKVEAETKIIDTLANTLDNIQHQVRGVSKTTLGIQSTQTLERIRQWLSPPDPSTNANHARNLRHEGTGTWLLAHSVFQSWKQGLRRHVWLHGLAGCGKTVLSTTILDSLASDTSRCLLSFFFDFNDVAKQTLEGLLRSLAWQLCQRQIGVAVLDSAFRAHHEGEQQPTTSSLETMVLSMLQHHKNISLVFDALDESTSREDLLRWIRRLVEGSDTSHIQLLCTGRPQAELEQILVPLLGWRNCLSIDKSGVAADIESYVARRLREEPAFQWKTMSPSLFQEIKHEIGHRSDGMFRWAACQLDSLAQCDSPKSTRAALKNLPKTLAKTYQRMLKSIPEEKRAPSLRLLKFLVHSKRPLSVSEAIDVIATDIEAESPCFDPEGRVYGGWRLLTYCPSLVSIVEGTSSPGISGPELHLAHFSVKEYLLGIDDMTPRAASVTIAKTCLVYLRDIQGELVQPIKDNYPLSSFAAKFWLDFAALAESDDEVLRLAWEFLQAEHTFLRWANLYEHGDKGPRSDSWTTNWLLPTAATRLYYASQGGLLRIVRRLLEKEKDINFICGTYGSALQAAVAEGHYEIVKILLDNGAHFGRMSGKHGPPLRLASQRGHSRIVQLLLDRGADVNGHDGERGNALHAASQAGYSSIVNMLLAAKAKVNAWGYFYGTAIRAASEEGLKGIVQSLLEHGADVNAIDANLGTPLQVASAKGFTDIVEILLEQNADVNLYAGFRQAPLLAALFEGNNKIAEMLLDRGADVNVDVCRTRRKGHGRALYFACMKGLWHLVMKILEKGADVNAREISGGTALIAATGRRGREAVMKLLGRGAHVNTLGKFYTSIEEVSGHFGRLSTALIVASHCGDAEIVTMLLDSGADVNLLAESPEGHFGTALAAASRAGHQKIAEILLDRGADTNSPVAYSGTALWCASSMGHRNITELLLDRGAEVNTQSDEDGSALLAASKNGHEEIVRLLLQRGAEVSSQNGEHGSALLAASELNYDHIVGMLLDRGADVNALGGYSGSSALEAASSNGNIGIVQMLLDHGANANEKHGKRGTALEAASYNGNHAIVDMLLRKGADLQSGSFYGSALIAATCGGQTSSVQKLLDLGADVNAQGSNRGNAILTASILGHAEIAKLLLDRGADFTVGDDFHSNALQAAAYGGSLEIVNILLQKGANVNAQGGVMANALHAATSQGHLEVVQLLVANGADTTTSRYIQPESQDTQPRPRLAQPVTKRGHGVLRWKCRP